MRTRRNGSNGATARTERFAVVLDLENLLFHQRRLHRLDEGLADIDALLMGVRHRGTLVMAIACCDVDLARALAIPVGRLGVRVFAHQGGPDRADCELVERLQGVPASCGTVVIGSGDHFFTSAVRELRARGKRVEVASRPHRISAELYLAADDYLEMPDARSAAAGL